MKTGKWLAACVLSGFVLAAASLWETANATQPAHHDIRLVLDPGKGTIAVTSRITVIGRDSITVKVAPWMRVSTLLVDGKATEHDTGHEDLTLKLSGAGKHRIDVVAKGTVPKPDEAGAGSQPVAGEDGVYLPGWAQWYPGLSDDSISYHLTVEVPRTHRAVATGEFKSEQLGAIANPDINTSIFVSQTSLEPPSVFAGPYTVTEKQFGKIRLRTYFHDGSADLAEPYLDAAAGYISRFEKQIGTYPYTDFHIISAPLPVGMGFPNLTYVGRRILPLPFMRGRSLAHEVLHNWWANGVQVDYDTGNWAEGLTSYMADYALAAQRDAKDAAEMRLGWLRDYAALPQDRDIAVNRFVSQRHASNQVIGYGKTASIFHMLKHEVGERHFDNAIKLFWNDNKFTKAGWSKIQAAFQTVTGSNLDWFFRQWTERAGAPRISLEGARTSQNGGGFSLEISLTQSSTPYRLKVPVEVTTQNGVQHFNIRLEGERIVENLQLDSKPVKLSVDPHHTLFRHLLPGEAPPILRDILLDSGARTIILHDDQAHQEIARELAKRLFRKAPDDLGSAEPQLPKSPFLVFGSSEQIGHFLAKFNLPERPKQVSGKGNGRVWTARLNNGNAALFIEAGDADVLRTMIRPLPHYRSKSFIVFDGKRVVEKGVWAPTDGPLTKRFD